MSPPPRRNARGSTRAKSRRKHSHRPTLSNAVSSASHQGMEQADIRQNQQLQGPRNVSVILNDMMSSMPPMHPAFGVGSIFYVHLIALIQGPDDMLFFPLSAAHS